MFLAVLGVLRRGVLPRGAFELFAIIAIGVFGPLGGAICQVASDLMAARRARLLHVWDYTVLAGIGLGLLVAGMALFHASNGDSIHVFGNRTFDIAGASAVLLVIIYALRDGIGIHLSKQSARSEVVGNELSTRDRAFAAGGLALMFLQALIIGLWEFGDSVVAGKPMWSALAGAVAIGGLGVVLGLALLRGNGLAPRGARLLLQLMVAGGFLAIGMSLLGLWQRESWQVIADIIISLAILMVLARRA